MLNLDLDGVRNVTALLIGRVGDMVVATPFLRGLRARFPDARIRLVISSQTAETARLIPFIDETAAAHRANRPAANLRLAAGLLARPCDLLIDLNPSFSRLSTALAALVRSPLKLSFKKGRFDGVFNRQLAPAGEREPMLDRYARLAQALQAPYQPLLELAIPPEDDARARQILVDLEETENEEFRVLIHPGNFKKFDNRWPEDNFVALSARLLQLHGVRLYYMAGPGEEAAVRAMIGRLGRPVPLLGPVALGTSAALIRRMGLCVLNITGTTHVAAAVGTPTFGFYSGYTDAVWKPRGPEHDGAVSSRWESCRDIPVGAAFERLAAHIGRLQKNYNKS